MKAFVYHKKSKAEKLILQEVNKPSLKSNEILVKVKAVSVNAADYRSMQLGIIPAAGIFGADVAGTVTAVGSQVTKFSVDDEVVADLSAHGFGGFAEYVAADQSAWVLKPASVPFDVAVSTPMAAVTAYQALKKGNLHQGQKVLICGAGGGVGNFAVMLAKQAKADVTAVCGNRNVEIMKMLHADRIITYQTESFTDDKETYDLILAINGNYALSDYKKALKPKGTLVIVGGSLSQLFRSMIFGKLMFLGSKHLLILSAKPSTSDLQEILNLTESKEIVPHIDRIFSFDQTMEAVNYVKEGHSQGKTVIMIDKS